MVELSILAVALAAGMLAAFNPCGIALLPTYLAIFLGHEDRTGRSPAVRALLGYGVGMGMVLAILALAMAILADGAADSIRRMTPYFIKVSGVFLVLAGMYVIAYAWIEYRAFQGEILDFAPVTWASDLSGAAGQVVRDLGAWTTLIVVAVSGLSLVVVADLFRRWRGIRMLPPPPSLTETPETVSETVGPSGPSPGNCRESPETEASSAESIGEVADPGAAIVLSEAANSPLANTPAGLSASSDQRTESVVPEPKEWHAHQPRTQ